MGNILVTPEQLHGVSGQLNAGAGNIQSILSQPALPRRPEDGQGSARQPVLEG